RLARRVDPLREGRRARRSSRLAGAPDPAPGAPLDLARGRRRRPARRPDRALRVTAELRSPAAGPRDPVAVDAPARLAAARARGSAGGQRFAANAARARRAFLARRAGNPRDPGRTEGEVRAAE